MPAKHSNKRAVHAFSQARYRAISNGNDAAIVSKNQGTCNAACGVRIGHCRMTLVAEQLGVCWLMYGTYEHLTSSASFFKIK